MFSVVIPTYNGAQRIRATLESLRRVLEATSLEVEVTIVDNGSADETSKVAGEFGEFRLLRVEPNRGFSGGVAAGVADARGDYVAVISDDIVLEPGFFEPLVEHFGRADTFAVMPSVLTGAGDKQEAYPYVPYLKRGRLRRRKVQDMARIERLATERPLPTLFTVGGMAVFHRERFSLLGGFSELYSPFYYEDIDLCWRAWSRGWGSYFEPRCVVRHFHAQGAIATGYRWRKVRSVKLCNRLLMNVVNLDVGLFRQGLHALLKGLTVLAKPKEAIAYYMGIPRLLSRLGQALRLRRRERAERTQDNQAAFAPIEASWKA